MSDIGINNYYQTAPTACPTPEPADPNPLGPRRTNRLRRSETSITPQGTYSSTGVFTPHPPPGTSQSKNIYVASSSTRNTKLSLEQRDAEKPVDYFGLLLQLDDEFMSKDGPGLTAEEIKSLLIYCRTCKKYMTKKAFFCEFLHLRKCSESRA